MNVLATEAYTTDAAELRVDVGVVITSPPLELLGLTVGRVERVEETDSCAVFVLDADGLPVSLGIDAVAEADAEELSDGGAVGVFHDALLDRVAVRVAALVGVVCLVLVEVRVTVEDGDSETGGAEALEELDGRAVLLMDTLANPVLVQMPVVVGTGVYDGSSLCVMDGELVAEGEGLTDSPDRVCEELGLACTDPDILGEDEEEGEDDDVASGVCVPRLAEGLRVGRGDAVVVSLGKDVRVAVADDLPEGVGTSVPVTVRVDVAVRVVVRVAVFVGVVRELTVSVALASGEAVAHSDGSALRVAVIVALIVFVGCAEDVAAQVNIGVRVGSGLLVARRVGTLVRAAVCVFVDVRVPTFVRVGTGLLVANRVGSPERVDVGVFVDVRDAVPVLEAAYAMDKKDSNHHLICGGKRN